MAPVPFPKLTAREWELILEALSTYQHHNDFRQLYKKLRGKLSKLPETSQESRLSHASGSGLSGEDFFTGTSSLADRLPAEKIKGS